MPTNKKRHWPVSLGAFDSAGEDLRNRMLLDWLSEDSARTELFKRINTTGDGHLDFPSRDAAARDCTCTGYTLPRPKVDTGHKPVQLVTCRDQIEAILINAQGRYSSRVYAELGGGNFMLALDPRSEPAHGAQRAAFRACFPHDATLLQATAHAACSAASVMGFRGTAFDLAEVAQQMGLRFVQLLMGYGLQDYPLLQTALGASYRALVYQVFERHFTTDPTLIPIAQREGAVLLARTSALIQAYACEDEDALRGTDDPALPPGLTPVLKCLGQLDGDLNGEQRAVIAVGAAIGSVGNVQAGICLAMQGLFADTRRLTAARQLVKAEPTDRPSARLADWQAIIGPLLKKNPPIPYLPRLQIDPNTGEMQAEYLLALAGGTASGGPSTGDDPLIWGLPGTAAHACAGAVLAWPLIVEGLRQVLSLIDLAQDLDPETGAVKGLERRHGFACVSYPFKHRRDRRCAQTSLNVAMRIRPPVREHSDAVRELIRAGAPRIEHLLRESRHVHFAWFELIEQDTVLVLHTVYDGPFGAYLQHFAQRAGDLFDRLFEHIVDPPPRPVASFPVEFAAHLLKYDRPPAMGYFFSAYPRSEVARIVRDEDV